jgi:hypothetical protein
MSAAAKGIAARSTRSREARRRLRNEAPGSEGRPPPSIDYPHGSALRRLSAAGHGRKRIAGEEENLPRIRQPADYFLIGTSHLHAWPVAAPVNTLGADILAGSARRSTVTSNAVPLPSASEIDHPSLGRLRHVAEIRPPEAWWHT